PRRTGGDEEEKTRLALVNSDEQRHPVSESSSSQSNNLAVTVFKEKYAAPRRAIDRQPPQSTSTPTTPRKHQQQSSSSGSRETVVQTQALSRPQYDDGAAYPYKVLRARPLWATRCYAAPMLYTKTGVKLFDANGVVANPWWAIKRWTSYDDFDCSDNFSSNRLRKPNSASSRPSLYYDGRLAPQEPIDRHGGSIGCFNRYHPPGNYPDWTHMWHWLDKQRSIDRIRNNPGPPSPQRSMSHTLTPPYGSVAFHAKQIAKAQNNADGGVSRKRMRDSGDSAVG
ncbi:unnamed protein product, partial [Amoebophrya sp. A25]